jgi:predicted dehydrogenase
MTITVVCERGTVRFEGHHHRWLSMKSPGDSWSEHASRALERDELFVRQASAFLGCIERGIAPVCSLEEGVASLRANLAILQSGKSGAWVNLRYV